MTGPTVAGLLAALGGVLWLVLLGISITSGIRHPALIVIEGFLIAAVVAQLHHVQSKASGFFGWAGVRVASAGILLLAVAVADLLLRTGVGGGALALGLVLAWVGVLLFGLGMFQSRSVSRPSALVFCGGWLLIYVHDLVGMPQFLLAPFGIGLVLVALDLLRPAWKMRSGPTR